MYNIDDILLKLYIGLYVNCIYKFIILVIILLKKTSKLA